MGRRALLHGGAALLFLACRRDAAPEPRPAIAPAEDAAPTSADHGGVRPDGRRGDRHARAAAQHRPSVKRTAGVVARANDRLVVIRPRGEEELALRVSPGTRVTVNGRAIRAEALREGAEVRAVYRTADGSRPTAVSIEADGLERIP